MSRVMIKCRVGELDALIQEKGGGDEVSGEDKNLTNRSDDTEL